MGDISVAAQREYLLAWLDRRGLADSTRLLETHVSILAFTEDRVWKCKKAVSFPFIDLSTAARRQANCEREVALNRRLAPDSYLGVVALADAAGTVVDHLVEMRRYPDDRRLSAVGGRDGDGGTECVDRIVDLLVRFHENAATGARIDAAASPAALTGLWESSLDEIGPFAGSVFDPVLYERVAGDARRYLAGRSRLFDERIAGGRIRDGHGDLLADDVFCLDDGPRVLDCLEFDERLRFGDVLADVTFLAMDLERLGRPDLARRLLDRYRERSGDRWRASLEHFYIAYRALVRAKIACLRAADDPSAPSEARALLALAAAHLASARVRVVVIGGPPATGKSTVARAVSALTGWPVIRSDEVRKRLAGVEPSTPAGAALGRGLYSESWSDRTYSALLEEARGELGRGLTVVLDASWSTEARRAEVEELAAATVSELTSFVCNVSPAIADERAARRAGSGDASDASPAIAAELRAHFAPWPGAVELDTAEGPDVVAREVLARLEMTFSQG